MSESTTLSKQLKAYYDKQLQSYKLIMKRRSVLENPNSCKILDLLVDYGSLTITDLWKKTGLKTYNNTFLNVKRLQNVDLVKVKKDYQAQGRPVKVKISNNIKGEKNGKEKNRI